MLLIGSMALEVQRPGLLPREPLDLDVVCTWSEYFEWSKKHKGDLQSLFPQPGGKIQALTKDNLHIEFEIGWSEPRNTARDLLDLTAADPGAMKGFGFGGWLGTVDVASPQALLGLKLSHRYLKNARSFRKTMLDIRFMRAAGFVLDDSYKAWVKAREKETYNYNHPNLMQNKMGFFSGDGVPYIYDHDSIHKAVALNERPAYTYFQKDGEQVAVDRKKWDALPEHIRLASVLEESYVLALERSQIPLKEKGGKVPDPKWSFLTALEKVCTSITSGWWREYAWENYDNALLWYDPEYVERFWKGVASGVVIKLPEKTV